MNIAIPGHEAVEIDHLVLDYNGTIALNGILCEGVMERLEKLSKELSVHVITADTYGSVQAQCAGGTVSVHVIGTESQDQAKLDFIESLGEGRCIAIGNGRNDALMLEHAALGFAVLQAEGASMKALAASDAVFSSINDALDALIHTKRLIATLRN